MPQVHRPRGLAIENAGRAHRAKGDPLSWFGSPRAEKKRDPARDSLDYAIEQKWNSRNKWLRCDACASRLLTNRQHIHVVHLETGDDRWLCTTCARDSGDPGLASVAERLKWPLLEQPVDGLDGRGTNHTARGRYLNQLFARDRAGRLTGP